MVFIALCTFSDRPLSMYQVSFNSFLCFQRYVLDKVFIVKIKKGSNSVNTDDRVMVLAFCNFPHSPLSVYQVSLNYLQYFQRSAPDKLNTAKIWKGKNSINTDDRVMSLALCTFPHSPLSLYQVSFIYLQYF